MAAGDARRGSWPQCGPHGCAAAQADNHGKERAAVPQQEFDVAAGRHVIEPRK
jgi:hypothetical protein